MDLNTADFSPLSDVAKKKVVNLIEKLLQVSKDCDNYQGTISILNADIEDKNKQLVHQQETVSFDILYLFSL